MIIGRRQRPERLLRKALDRAERLLSKGCVAQALPALVADLDRVRSALPPSRWREAAGELPDSHPVIDALRAGPLGERARRCAGGPDPIALDLVYGCTEISGSGGLAAEAFAFEHRLPTLRALRDAASGMRAELRMLAATTPNAAVIALGCAHMRELDTTLLARFADRARFVGVEPSRDAVAALRRRIADPRVQVLHAGDAAAVARERRLGARYDLAYRIVPRRTAGGGLDEAPLEAVFALLKPGGVLYVAALASGRRDAAYLEAVHGWWLEEIDPKLLRSAAASLSGAATLRAAAHEPAIVLRCVRSRNAGSDDGETVRGRAAATLPGDGASSPCSQPRESGARRRRDPSARRHLPR